MRDKSEIQDRPKTATDLKDEQNLNSRYLTAGMAISISF
jgi:hypothetical protein